MDPEKQSQRIQNPPTQRPRRQISFERLVSLYLLFTIFLCFTDFDSVAHFVQDRWTSTKLAIKPLAKDPERRALALLSQSPIIDGHIDLPILTRYLYANQIDDFDLNDRLELHVDIPRIRKGRMGGFFWSVFVPCPEDEGYPPENGSNFTTPTFRVRDTMEQIDVARLLIGKYSDTFELVSSVKEWKRAIRRGKVGGMLGVEGGHQLGSTLSTIRTYYSLGVRYITLTHTCHNPLADSCGSQEHPLSTRWNGLSSFGREAIREMNRLGMMVDVSHTAPQTASDALSLSEAPVIFSHSNARGVHGAVRNVPDSILRRIGKIDEPNRKFNLSEDGEQGQGWGNDNGEIDKAVPGGDTIIMVNFSPDFVSEWPDGTGPRANVSLVADHADYLGRLAGRQHVGIGSDFDGILKTPEGLENVSTYPNLIAELIRRGWSDEEVRGFTSGNILRILEKVEHVSHRLRHRKPSTKIFEGRTDLKKHDGF